ncbi:MAG: hypothetical protein KGN98_07665 [Alphaproteobacteria bacterium]|nr:hypothetical protein [Alphaproteobacteria bacterium]
MRDARILTWLLADPARQTELRVDQMAAVRQIAAAEGLDAALEARLAGLATASAVVDPAADVCRAAANLFGVGDLDRGLFRLWHIHSLILQGQTQAGFWDAVRREARRQAVTACVSRALRLCFHLFETPVDTYLAWQGQRADIFFLGRLLARNGAGEETARVLRAAFKWRARWLAHRASARREDI